MKKIISYLAALVLLGISGYACAGVNSDMELKVDNDNVTMVVGVPSTGVVFQGT